jgi:hypothetical protein
MATVTGDRRPLFVPGSNGLFGFKSKEQQTRTHKEKIDKKK